MKNVNMDMSKPVPVGRFRLGLRWVQLFVAPNTASGSVELLPDDQGQTKIFVGVEDGWTEALATLLHELYEASLVDLNVRYKKKPSFSEESSDYMFFMSHNELGEAHERVGDFLNHALSPFTRVFEKVRAAQRKKEKLDRKKKK
jgi:hypothetical protein